MTVTKLYVPVITLSAQDNAKLLEQLKLLVLKEQVKETNINEKFHWKGKIKIYIF